MKNKLKSKMIKFQVFEFLTKNVHNNSKKYIKPSFGENVIVHWLFMNILMKHKVLNLMKHL